MTETSVGSLKGTILGLPTKIQMLLQSLIIYFVSILITGYHVYTGNQVLIFPFVFSINSPNLYPNDPFFSTLVHYAAPIWRLVGMLSNYFSLEIVLVVLFLVTRALILYAAARLGMTLTNGSWLAGIGAMAFFALFPSPLVGHGTLIADHFEHTSMSLGFLLLAATAFYSVRPIYWALWLALGFNLNSMYGTYACLYFAAVFLIDAEYRKDWKNWIKSGLLFLLLASPTILITASAFRIEAYNTQLWLQASEARSPQHLYPHTWVPLAYFSLSVFILFYVFTLYSVRKEHARLFKHGLIWLAVGLFWLFYGFFAAYIAKSPAMLVMHPARGMDLWFSFAVIATIAVFSNLIETSPTLKRLYVILLFVSILWYYIFDFQQLTLIIWLIIGIGVLLNPIWSLVFKQAEPLRLSYIVVFIVMIFGIYTLSKTSLSDFLQHPIGYPDPEIREIATWAEENTSIEKQFLVNPNWGEFRSLSKRPVFVTWKDGSAILWERSYVDEWVSRTEALGYDFDNPEEIGMTSAMVELWNNLYEDLKDDQVISLASEYPIDYWVVALDHPSSFTEVFRTAQYKVLELPGNIE